MALIYLSLGSNIGDRCGFLRIALDYLKKYIKNIQISKIRETEPIYYTQQPYFLNQVIKGETCFDPITLLGKMKEIQKTVGRCSVMSQNQPRIIDIDLLDYNGWTLQTQDLTLPHPRIFERRFVLEPLLDIDSTWRWNGKSAQELLDSL